MGNLNMKKGLLLLFLGLSSFWLTAQNTVQQLFEKADAFTYKNLDSALHYAQAALRLTQSEHDVKQTFKAYRTIGFVYEENNLLVEAQNAYQHALTIAEAQLSDADKCAIYNDWAIIHKKMGQYPIAQDYHWRTIKKAEKTQDWVSIEASYNGLGTLYAMTHDDEKAILYYRKSIEAAEKCGNKRGILLTQENICHIFLDAKNLNLAYQNVVKTYDLAVAFGDSIELASVLCLFGDIETALGKTDEALLKYHKALSILEQSGDKAMLSTTYMSLGDFYFQRKKYAEAATYFEKTDQLATYLSPVCAAEFYHKLGNLYVVQNQVMKAQNAFNTSLQKANTLGLTTTARANHLAFAELWQREKNLEKANGHLQIANSLGDSLYEAAHKKVILEEELKFNLEKRDLQIEYQEQSLSKLKSHRIVLAGALVVVLVLLFFVWRQMKAKLEATRYIELLMKELHHRVKNNLQTVTSLMRLQARHITDPNISAVLAESRSRLEAITMIHQQLYRSNDVQTVNFKLFLEDLIQKQIFAFGMTDKKFHTQLTLNYDFINVDIALPLGLIINELLTNSFKYAYPLADMPHLTIEIEGQKLFYADNGKGMPTTSGTENKSFGLQLITALSKQLNGKFQFGNNNGMFFILNF